MFLLKVLVSLRCPRVEIGVNHLNHTVLAKTGLISVLNVFDREFAKALHGVKVVRDVRSGSWSTVSALLPGSTASSSSRWLIAPQERTHMRLVIKCQLIGQFSDVIPSVGDSQRGVYLSRVGALVYASLFWLGDEKCSDTIFTIWSVM